MLPTPAHATPPLRHEAGALLRLAGPVVVSQFATNGVALILTAVVGRLGEGPLAAVAYASAWYYLGFIVLLGMMLSVAPRVAGAHGAGDPAGVARAGRAGVALALGLSALFLPLAYGVAWLLDTRSPAGLPPGLAGDYLRLYALGMPATLLFTGLRGVLEGTAHPRAVTGVALLGVGLCALLAPALAYGAGPLPALGLRGAALGVVLSLWWNALGVAWLVRRSGRLSHPDRGRTLQEVGALLRLGGPIGLTLGAEGSLFTVTALLMARFGPQALAAHNVALQIITAVFMVPLGLASATGIRVAQHRGAGAWRQARRAGLLGAGIAAGVMLPFGAAYVLAPGAVIGLFVPNQGAHTGLVATASAFLLIATLFQVSDGLQVTANSALRGLQDTGRPMLISLLSYWPLGLGTGAGLAFGLGLGPRGLWFGLTSGLVVAAALLLRRFLVLTARGVRGHI